MFRVDRWFHRFGIKSKRFRIYNPLPQNEGQTKVLARLNMVERLGTRPILVVMGDVHWIPEDLEIMLRRIVAVCIQTAKIVNGLVDFRRVYLHTQFHLGMFASRGK